MKKDNRLPKDWNVSPLKELCHRLIDGSHLPPPKQDAGFPMLSAKNVENGRITFDGRLITEEAFKQEDARAKIRPGDVLLTIVGTIGRTAVVPDGCLPFTLQRSVAVIKPKEMIPTFLMYQFQAEHVQRDLLSRARGTAQMGIYLKSLGEIAIHVPPPDQQLRIVAKIEELFSDLDAGVAALKRAKANLKRYRAAVLKAAVEGKLTQQWRADHPDTEPAEALLARILTQRRQHWEQDQLARYTAKGKQPPKDWKDKYKEPAKPDTSELPELPKGWCWASMDQVGDVQLGRQRSPKHHDGPDMRPYLRVANVFEDRIDISDVMQMNFTPDEFERYRLGYGDILLNEGQSMELIGRPAMYRDEVPGACFTNTLVRFRPVNGVDGAYALRVFLAYLKNGRFQKIATITVNIAHLGAGRFAVLEFPLPPVEEQIQIVAEVAAILSKIDAAATAIGNGLRRAARLRQSILKRAFEGDLVRQDSSTDGKTNRRPEGVGT